MPSPPRPLQRAAGALHRALLVLCGLCLLAMVLLMNTEILTRYVLGFSTQISDEYSGYLFTAITMLCLAPALREGRFLRIDGLVARLPARARALPEAADALAGAAVCAVLAYATWLMVQASSEIGAVSLTVAETPQAWPQALMPAGFALLGLAYLARGAARVRRALAGAGPEADPDRGQDQSQDPARDPDQEARHVLD